MSRRSRIAARLKGRLRQALSLEEGSLLGGSPELDLVFADDSRQHSPSRPAMGGLVAVGGFAVPGCDVPALTAAVDAACREHQFPPGEEFKWSPGKELWMRSHLVGESRQRFFGSVLNALVRVQPCVIVVVSDTKARTATGCDTPEEDVAQLFLERVEHQCKDNYSLSLVIVDRPSGGRSDEDAFLARCLDTIQEGTKFVKPRHIVHNVVSGPSHLSRMLQLADLVTGVVTARVAGESRFSPPLFEMIRPLFYRSGGRVGGCGLKIHPALRYGNLYHWLGGDSHFWRSNVGVPLPYSKWPYSASEFS